MISKPIPELDVVSATVLFLINRGVIPYQFSLPKGKGIDSSSYQKHISGVLGSVGLSASFSTAGPDILAISKNEWWQVECKGAGSGKKQTQRNNFDRALASAVSYYSDLPERLPQNFENAMPFLGLSLPGTDEYIHELMRRVRKCLRQKLNLWILLYETESDTLRAVSPSDEY